MVRELPCESNPCELGFSCVSSLDCLCLGDRRRRDDEEIKEEKEETEEEREPYILRPWPAHAEEAK